MVSLQTCSNSSQPSCPTASTGVMDSMVSVLMQSILIAQCSISSPKYYTKDYTPNALAYGLDEFDFVVVGTGAAGSVVASRLSENPHWKVLAIEAGADASQESKVPSMWNILQRSEQTFNYSTESSNRACNAFQGNKCYLSRGMCIGGNSEIDNMLYLTGNPRDYDRWCSAGNYGWCYKDVKPYFDKSITPQGDYSHPKGYLQVNPFEQYDHIYSQLLWDAIQEVGQPIVTEFGNGVYLGYSHVKGCIANGHRVGPGTSYLGKVAGRPNLKVMKNTRVIKMIHECNEDRIESLELLVDNKFILEARVRKEVILSAGAIETPKLLMLSGIGPKTVLSPLNIPTLIDLPVGEGLQDMVTAWLFVKLDPQKPCLEQCENNLYKYLTCNEGPLRSNGISSLIGFIKTNNDHKDCYPDIQVSFEIFQQNDTQFARHADGYVVQEALKQFMMEIIKTNDIMIISLNLLNPYSKGRLTLRSSSFLDSPILEPNYLKDPRDVESLVQGMQNVAQLITTSAFAKYNAELIHVPLPECDVFPFGSTDYLKCFLKYDSASGLNPVGTAKMGARYDQSSVVTPRLMVKGMSNLRVVDRSIMPSQPSGLSIAPNVMVAEKASDFIKQDYNGMSF